MAGYESDARAPAARARSDGVAEDRMSGKFCGPDRPLFKADTERTAAGNFGMEKGHYEVSENIARGGILAKAEAAPDRAILADGFSCRTQVRDLAGLDSRHLVQIIAEALRPEAGKEHQEAGTARHER